MIRFIRENNTHKDLPKDAGAFDSGAQSSGLVRRIGTSGVFTVVGSATASGSIVTEVVTYSAVNTTTGVVTVSADYLGLGQASFDLGIEILAGIKELEREYPNDFTVRPLQLSEYYN